MPKLVADYYVTLGKNADITGSIGDEVGHIEESIFRVGAALRVGLEVILGTFIAGAMVSLLDRDELVGDRSPGV